MSATKNIEFTLKIIKNEINKAEFRIREKDLLSFKIVLNQLKLVLNLKSLIRQNGSQYLD